MRTADHHRRVRCEAHDDELGVDQDIAALTLGGFALRVQQPCSNAGDGATREFVDK